MPALRILGCYRRQYNAQELYWLPLAGAIVGLATLLVTFAIFYSQDRDYGGMDFAYISDAGRNYPEKYAFVIGKSSTFHLDVNNETSDALGAVAISILSIAIHSVLANWLSMYTSGSSTWFVFAMVAE